MVKQINQLYNSIKHDSKKAKYTRNLENIFFDLSNKTYNFDNHYGNKLNYHPTNTFSKLFSKDVPNPKGVYTQQDKIDLLGNGTETLGFFKFLKDYQRDVKKHV